MCQETRNEGCPNSSTGSIQLSVAEEAVGGVIARVNFLQLGVSVTSSATLTIFKVKIGSQLLLTNKYYHL